MYIKKKQSEAEGLNKYLFCPLSLAEIGLPYDPACMNFANGAGHFLYCQWTNMVHFYL